VRIDEIEILNLRFEYPPGGGFRYAGGTATGRVTTLVRVRAEGLTGTGSAYTHPEIARITIESQLAPYLRGRDVTDAPTARAALLRLINWYGRSGPAVTTVGAIDTALWDLFAQRAGQPLWRFLGGERGTVPAYASGLLWQDDLDELRRETTRHLGQGFRRVKMRLGRSRDYDVAAFDAVRQAAGPGNEVIVDGSLRYGDEDAAWLGDYLASRGAVWFEEPFEPDNIEAYIRLRQRTGVPVAAGENETSVRGLSELLRRGAVDIIQPDASRAGGITSVLQVAGLAQTAGARVATHTWSDAVAVLANGHAVASVPAGMTVEVDRTGNPFIDELLAEPLRIADGQLLLPETPGLGVRLDETVLASYRLPAGRIPDGNYSDMFFGPPPESATPYPAHGQPPSVPRQAAVSPVPDPEASAHS
jgi:L-alanine-DL-glutamate epimerase-like enolase superfamily enzyme